MKTFVLIFILAGAAFALDVSVDTILAPSSTIDSGQTIIPRVVISNMSSGPAIGISAYLTIYDGTPGGYKDSIVYFDMEGSTSETLSYEGWVPRLRDSMTVVARTECNGDTYPQNDTFRRRFLVRVRDIAVTQIIMPAPDTTLDSGVTFFPRCRVWNFGNVSVTFDVRFTIGEYRSTRNVSLIPGGARVATAPDLYTAMPGDWACQAYAVVTGDLHPGNNIMDDTFTVHGTITKDVAALAVLAPTGVVDTEQTIVPKARVGNNGGDSATFKAFFIVQNSGGVEVYAESTEVLLGGGDSVVLEYPPVKFSILGNYTAACSVYMFGDQNTTNDVKRISFRVVDHISGDIGVTVAEWPRDTVDTFTVFHPWCKLKNYGMEDCAVYVFLVFSDTVHDRVVYRDSVFIRLAAGEEVHVDFDSVRFTVLGLHEGLCWFEFAYDHPDTVGWPFWVVPGYGLGDVGVVRILSPSVSYDPDTSLTPAAVWKNYCDHPMRFAACFTVRDSHGVEVYFDAWLVSHLAAGAETTIRFMPFYVGNDTLSWWAFCSTYAVTDTNSLNDTLGMWFRFPPGVEEGQPRASSQKLPPTVMRRLPAGAVAFDATGRRVLNPKAGVCFIMEQSASSSQHSGRSAAGGERSALRVRKVVVTR